jgi:DNA (cytosine-5)-methyltransferase 1
VLEAVKLKVGELDLLDGSPPCAAFSTAGKRHKSWGKQRKYSETVQRSDDLFFEFARMVEGLRPKMFIAENVSGLTKGTSKGYFLEILRELKRPGYNVIARLVDAQWLGVPQARQRIIFMGVRADLGLAPAFPTPLPYRYSVRDALPWISSAVHDTSGLKRFCAGNITDRPAPAVTVGVNSVNSQHFRVKVMQAERYDSEIDTIDRPALTITTSPTHKSAPRVECINADADISRFAIGQEAKRLTPGEQSDRFFSLTRAHPDQPSPTICASHGGSSIASVIHPTESRKFTIAELKRICSFPDDFELTGTYAQQWERLGRAVPPLMMRAVAVEARAILEQAKCAGC